jgi:hypothetical protein
MNYDAPQIETRDEIETFLENVAAEVHRAIVKFPQPNPTLAALTEEVGEVAKALLHLREGKAHSWGDVYDEAVQVAAMALRIAVEGDPTIGSVPNSENTP